MSGSLIWLAAKLESFFEDWCNAWQLGMSQIWANGFLVKPQNLPFKTSTTHGKTWDNGT